MQRFKSIAALLSLIAFLSMPDLGAHQLDVKCLDKEWRCRKVQRIIHRKFGRYAHEAIYTFSCESGLRKWSRVHDDSTQYKGIVSASADFREAHPEWSWRIPDQIEAAKNASRQSVREGDPRFAHWGEGASWGCA